MLKILIIEDDIIDQLALTRLIKKNDLDCDVTVSMNIADSKTLIIENDFDLIICDLNLPDGRAFDLGALIRQQTFILLSGHLEKEIIDEANQYGAVQVLQKSSDLGQLTSVLDLIKEMSNLPATDKRTDTLPPKTTITKFNIQYLMSTFNQDAQYVSEIIELFLKNNPIMIKELISELEKKNKDKIKKIAHQLKARCVMIGIKEPQLIAEKIEKESHNLEIPILELEIESLKNALEIIYPELETALLKLKKY